MKPTKSILDPEFPYVHSTFSNIQTRFDAMNKEGSLMNNASKEMNTLREQMIDIAITELVRRLDELCFPIGNRPDFETRLADLLRFA